MDALVRLLWRRKLPLLGMSVLGILLGLGAALCTPASYRARTALQLEVGVGRENADQGALAFPYRNPGIDFEHDLFYGIVSADFARASMKART